MPAAGNTVTVALVAIDEDLARQLAGLAETLEDAAEQRERLIVVAHNAGASLREIATAAGMSHIGVRKLIQRVQDDYVVRDKDGRVVLILEAKRTRKEGPG